MSDQQILENIGRGDESALDHLYQKHYRMIEQLVLRNNGNRDEAKDIFQDALIIFWEKAVKGDLVLTSKISTYLYSIAQNLWRKALDRKAKYSSETPDGSEEMDTESGDQIRIINECLEKLGENCRRILRYYYFDGLPMKEIAIKLNFANSDTVKTKKYKCKKSLDKMVKSMYSAQDFLN